MNYDILPAPTKTDSPAWRSNEVFNYFESNKSAKQWPCAYQNLLNEYLVGNTKDSNIDKAYTLYYIPFTRSTINALLLAGDNMYNIARRIEEDEEVILLYAKLFFDTSVFNNKLIRMAFVRQLGSSTKQEEFDKGLMSAALQLGPNYVYWKLGLSKDNDTMPDTVVVDMMKDSYWKFNEMKIKNSMELTKESRTWIPAALSAAGMASKSIKQLSSEAESVKIKLLSIAKTVPASDIMQDLKG
jgi:hypothetical protein